MPQNEKTDIFFYYMSCSIILVERLYRYNSMLIDVIIASTSRFKTYGPVSRPEEATFRLLPDGIKPIREAVRDSRAGAIVICGGTGLTHLDLTLEAVEPMFEKEIPGFGEIFRLRSLEEVGTRAMLTRASAGVYKGKPVFCLPGSPNAARLGIELILAEIEHIVKHISE
jgi:molybdenum cofactor biosynthesis protein B